MTANSGVDRSRWQLFIKGGIAMLPLSIAVLPWGVLAGSFAIEAGFGPVAGQAMSAIVFAGAAQLVAMGMVQAGAGLSSIFLTTLIITARHLLYSVAMRDKISPLPLRWRVILGFLLTDELFAVCGKETQEQFKPWFAFGAGFSFYLSWNLATLLGIVMGSQIPGLEHWGLEFAIAATFIAIVIPSVTSLPVLACVCCALFLSVVLTAFQVEGSLMIASLVAMAVGYFLDVRVNKS
ncbi:AzlC family ABC transporter permease [Motilimonas pumila]|uniref:Branched-chain amino acid ABC transporter permease n=1 Tax=Motilimonas pumila TaxID=2303987 RepID=A0A418YE93_9GAMM|nr:AzlC family ABC transporter permease [Motilimonas pumila]RJG47484.1 branched-chain amino acid ABC transporter permease [Motilimonas pumila]